MRIPQLPSSSASNSQPATTPRRPIGWHAVSEQVYDPREAWSWSCSWRVRPQQAATPGGTTLWLAIGNDDTVWLLKEPAAASRVMRHPLVRHAQRLVSFRQPGREWSTAERAEVVEHLVRVTPRLGSHGALNLFSVTDGRDGRPPRKVNDGHEGDIPTSAEAAAEIARRLAHAVHPSRTTRALAAVDVIGHRQDRSPISTLALAHEVTRTTWHVTRLNESHRLERDMGAIPRPSGAAAIASLNVDGTTFWYPTDATTDLEAFVAKLRFERSRHSVERLGLRRW